MRSEISDLMEMLGLMAVGGLCMLLPRARARAAELRRKSYKVDTSYQFEVFPQRSRLEYEVLRRGHLLGPEQMACSQFLLHRAATDPETGAAPNNFSVQLFLGPAYGSDHPERAKILQILRLPPAELGALVKPLEVIELPDTIVVYYSQWAGATVKDRWGRLPLRAALKPMADTLCLFSSMGMNRMTVSPGGTPVAPDGTPCLVPGCAVTGGSPQGPLQYFVRLAGVLGDTSADSAEVLRVIGSHASKLASIHELRRALYHPIQRGDARPRGPLPPPPA